MKICKKLLLILSASFLLTGCGEAGPAGPQGPKGDKGDTGDTGTTGQNGTNGTNGTDGITPHIGNNGNWFIGETDTGISAQGSKGDNGQNGTNGTNGTDGITPHIGNNGNWFIGETDTGISAQGAKGDNGQNGTNGTNGTDGVPGKSAYELYLSTVPEGQQPMTEEEWLVSLKGKDGFDDDTDYSNYGDFMFTPMVYHGIKSYSASYIGVEPEIVVPSSFNKLPVVQFTFGAEPYTLNCNNDPLFIEKIYIPKSVKILNVSSEFTNYVLNEMTDEFVFKSTEIWFCNSLDYLVAPREFTPMDIYFEGTLEELSHTNLGEWFNITNIHCSDGVLDNFDKANRILTKAQLMFNQLVDELIPGDRKLKGEGLIEFPKTLRFKVDGEFVELPLTIETDIIDSALQVVDNIIYFDASYYDFYSNLSFYGSVTVQGFTCRLSNVHVEFEMIPDTFVISNTDFFINHLTQKSEELLVRLTNNLEKIDAYCNGYLIEYDLMLDPNSCEGVYVSNGYIFAETENYYYVSIDLNNNTILFKNSSEYDPEIDNAVKDKFKSFLNINPLMNKLLIIGPKTINFGKTFEIYAKGDNRIANFTISSESKFVSVDGTSVSFIPDELTRTIENINVSFTVDIGDIVYSSSFSIEVHIFDTPDKIQLVASSEPIAYLKSNDGNTYSCSEFVVESGNERTSLMIEYPNDSFYLEIPFECECATAGSMWCTINFEHYGFFNIELNVEEQKVVINELKDSLRLQSMALELIDFYKRELHIEEDDGYYINKDIEDVLIYQNLLFDAVVESKFIPQNGIVSCVQNEDFGYIYNLSIEDLEESSYEVFKIFAYCEEYNILINSSVDVLIITEYFKQWPKEVYEKLNEVGIPTRLTELRGASFQLIDPDFFENYVLKLKIVEPELSFNQYIESIKNDGFITDGVYLYDSDYIIARKDYLCCKIFQSENDILIEFYNNNNYYTNWLTEIIDSITEGYVTVEIPKIDGDFYKYYSYSDSFYFGGIDIIRGNFSGYKDVLQTNGFNIIDDSENSFTATKDNLLILVEGMYNEFYEEEVRISFHKIEGSVYWPSETISEALDGVSDVQIPEASADLFEVINPEEGDLIDIVAHNLDFSSFLTALMNDDFVVYTHVSQMNPEELFYIANKGNIEVAIIASSGLHKISIYESCVYFDEFPSQEINSIIVENSTFDVTLPSPENIMLTYYEVLDDPESMDFLFIDIIGDISSYIEILNSNGFNMRYVGIFDLWGYFLGFKDDVEVYVEDYQGHYIIYLTSIEPVDTTWPESTINAYLPFSLNGLIPEAEGSHFKVYQYDYEEDELYLSVQVYNGNIDNYISKLEEYGSEYVITYIEDGDYYLIHSNACDYDFYAKQKDLDLFIEA